MKQREEQGIGAASVPQMRVVYKGIDLSEEIKSVPTEDAATYFTLQALGEDLIELEGLSPASSGEDFLVEKPQNIILWDDSED